MIARQIGYSTFHFCRVFVLSQGLTLMEYVRKRRLLLSREDLLNKRTIIEVALDYGYETASGFTKAFRKEFGCTPTAYICRVSSYNEKNSIKKIGEIMMSPVISKREAFKVAGYGINTNVAERYTRDVAAYWETYEGDNLECKMYAQLKPEKHGEVGICVPCADNGDAVYLLGVVVADFEKVVPEMMTVTVPEAEYAVFTTHPVSEADIALHGEGALAAAVKRTWNFIFNEWFPNSGYAFDESKTDFEFYDERCHTLENAVAEIYVPVVRKTDSNDIYMQ